MKKDVASNQSPDNTVTAQNPYGSSSVTENTSTNGLIRKITARMLALRRFLTGLSSVEENNPPQFYKVQIDTINRLWSQLEDLYDQSWDQMSNPLTAGLNQDGYDSLNDLVHTILPRLYKYQIHPTRHHQLHCLHCHFPR